MGVPWFHAAPPPPNLAGLAENISDRGPLGILVPLCVLLAACLLLLLTRYLIAPAAPALRIAADEESAGKPASSVLDASVRTPRFATNEQISGSYPARANTPVHIDPPLPPLPPQVQQQQHDEHEHAAPLQQQPHHQPQPYSLHSSGRPSRSRSPALSSGFSWANDSSASRAADAPELRADSPSASWSMSRMSRILAPEASTYHPSRYAPSISRPARQIVSGGATWFTDRAQKVEFRPDGSPKTCSQMAAIAAQQKRTTRGVAWHRSAERTFAHGILTFSGEQSHSLDDGERAAQPRRMPALPHPTSSTYANAHPPQLDARNASTGTFVSPSSSASGGRSICTTTSTSSRCSETLKAQRLAMLQAGEAPAWLNREKVVEAPPPMPSRSRPYSQCVDRPAAHSARHRPSVGDSNRISAHGARVAVRPLPSQRQLHPPRQCLNGKQIMLQDDYSDPAEDAQDEGGRALLALNQYTELTTGYESSDSLDALSERVEPQSISSSAPPLRRPALFVCSNQLY